LDLAGQLVPKGGAKIYLVLCKASPVNLNGCVLLLDDAQATYLDGFIEKLKLIKWVQDNPVHGASFLASLPLG